MSPPEPPRHGTLSRAIPRPRPGRAGTLPSVDTVTCPSCGADNGADRKFCRQCGTGLAARCSQCGRDNDPGDRFCGDCGSPLTTAASAAQPPTPAEAERRLVTVLFADLVGFTPFSEHRDAEDVRSMLTDYFERCRSVIEKFGGTVDKFIGDAVMAVWGAATAREDDAERAVRAALGLVDSVHSLAESIGAEGLALRAGVMTGETSVGPGGNAMGLVVGDMVNTASRLQSIAEPGTVLVGKTTVDLTNRAIVYRSVGEQTVKGKVVPVEVWQATGIATRVGGADRSDVVEPPFVGRDNEYRLLKDQLAAIESERRARLVSLVGEAGIGKSRLAWELKKYADGLVETTYWHQGRSPSYGDGLTFWALGEMVRSRAGIAENDDEHRSRTKLRTAVVEFCTDPTEQRWIEPRLAGLLGLAEMPPGDRAELFAALRTFFQRIADRAPTVMVFEDLHWADDGMIEFVEELVDRSTRSPILVITLSRPELFDRHPGWGSTHRHGMGVSLAPLPDPAMREMVTGTAPDLPAAVVDQVVQRAGGIPLYAVEFIRMHQADPDGSEAAIPDSLRAMIGARIDRLDPTSRSLLQDAAVLGLTFSTEAVAHLRDEPMETVADRLRALVKSEILELEDDPRSPERGQYRFVQGLIREVAYARLQRAERRDRHLAVAAAYEALDDPEVAGAIASHYLSAHKADPGQSNDELLTKARRSLFEAARRAMALQSHRQALGLCRQALAIEAASVLERELHGIAARAASAIHESQAAIEHARQALQFAEAEGEAETIIGATYELGFVMNELNDSGALAVLEPAYETLEHLDTEARVLLAAEYARSFIFAGDFERILAPVDRALAAAERLGMYETIANGFATKGAALGYRGRIQEAIALLRGAIEIAEAHDLPRVAARAANNLAVELSSENWYQRREMLERGAEFAERSGEEEYRLRMRHWRAQTLLLFGHIDEAMELWAPEEFESSDVWMDLAEYSRLECAAIRGSGYDPDRHGELLSRLSRVDGQWAAISRDLECALRLYAGDLRAASDRAIEADHALPYPVGIEAGLFAAITLRDGEAVDALAQKLSHHARSASAVDALRQCAEAAGLALAGDIERAAGRFASAVSLAQRVSSGLATAAIEAAFWGLVGDAVPAAREAGERAAAWIERTGCHGLRAFWPQLPDLEAEASVAG